MSGARPRAGWAGIVELGGAHEGLVGLAWRGGPPVRRTGRRLTHVADPYNARNAVAVPVGQSHVVAYGSNRPIPVGEAQLLTLAAGEVDRAHGEPTRTGDRG